MNLFSLPENQPKFRTDMTSVLEDALKNHKSKSKPETILIITDGAPDNKKTVKRVLVEATLEMKTDEELSISIIQVGDDERAAAWLKELDENLVKDGAKFDIVDTMSCNEMKNIDFAEIIRRSIAN